MISVAEAQRRLLARTVPMPARRVRLRDAAGRIAMRDVAAPFDLPRHTTSSMDGYALRSRDTRGATASRPVRLRVRSRPILAGSAPGPPLASGTAVRVMTGAPLPAGADAVIPQEEARRVRGALVRVRPVPEGRCVRPAAEDSRKGDVVLASGERVHPPTIGLLSALGIRWVRVRRAPRVAIVITGSEVRRPGARALPPRAVRDSHAAFLEAALREFDIRPVTISFVRDRASEIRSKLARAMARADLVLTTGGVSVGERDLTRPVLSSLGVRTVFWGVAQQPGKPLYFGRRRGVAVLGLPGNPASTMVCYCEYVRPAIRRLLGESRCLPEEWVARLASPVRAAGTRARFLRGRLRADGSSWRVTVARRQASNLLAGFRESDCLIALPARPRRALSVGARVRVHPLPWRRA